MKLCFQRAVEVSDFETFLSSFLSNFLCFLYVFLCKTQLFWRLAEKNYTHNLQTCNHPVYVVILLVPVVKLLHFENCQSLSTFFSLKQKPLKKLTSSASLNRSSKQQGKNIKHRLPSKVCTLRDEITFKYSLSVLSGFMRL